MFTAHGLPTPPSIVHITHLALLSPSSSLSFVFDHGVVVTLRLIRIYATTTGKLSPAITINASPAFWLPTIIPAGLSYQRLASLHLVSVTSQKTCHQNNKGTTMPSTTASTKKTQRGKKRKKVSTTTTATSEAVRTGASFVLTQKHFIDAIKTVKEHAPMYHDHWFSSNDWAKILRECDTVLRSAEEDEITSRKVVSAFSMQHSAVNQQ